MSKIIEKYRKEAFDSYLGNYNQHVSWREAILEAFFRPCGKYQVPGGKKPMSHLHPDTDKLHMPEHVYIADWRKYRVEDHPALVNFQKKCHTAGLHDPWLRNFAFNFYPNMHGPARSVTTIVTTGIVFGFIAGATIFGLEKIYDHYYPIDYPHSPEYIAKHGKSHKHH